MPAYSACQKLPWRCIARPLVPPDPRIPPDARAPASAYFSASLAAQIAEGRRLYARLENGQAYGEDEQTPNDLLSEPNL